MNILIQWIKVDQAELQILHTVGIIIITIILYQSGWTNNGRVIGNPLFTLGRNKGRYSDGHYIINNRLKAHHFGFQGQIFKKIYYKTLFTYSENFGIYPDEDYFKSNGLVYRFDGGLIQRSGLIELIKNIFEQC